MFDFREHGEQCELVMARPPVNAMTAEFLSGLQAAHAEAVAQGVRGIVISGRAGLFSAGLDVPALIDLDRAAMQDFWELFFRTMLSIAASPVPIAAAITGHAPAGGAVLALHCDYRVVARGEFTLGLNETTIGLPVPVNIYCALEAVVGTRQAGLLATTGRLLSPDECLAVGLVDEVCPPEAVVSHALGWLRELAALPERAMNASRLTAKERLLGGLADVEGYARAAADAWFAPDTQANLRQLVAKLGK